MKTNFKKPVVTLILLCTLLLLPMGCSKKTSQAQEENTQKVYVETEQPIKAPIGVAKEFSGKLKPLEEIMVFPKLPGKVSKLNVSVGQRVKKNSVLLELDGSDLDAQMAQARAGYNTAVASVDMSRERLEYLKEQQEQMEEGIYSLTNTLDKLNSEAEKIIETVKTLPEQIKLMESDFLSGKITEEELKQQLASLGLSQDSINIIIQKYAVENQLSSLQSAKMEIDAAIKSLPFDENTLKAQESQAKAGLDAAQKAKDNLKLYSPIDGTVSSITVVEGGMALQTMAPVTVIDESKLILDINLNEFDVAKIKAGENVKVYIDAQSREIGGMVEWVSPGVDMRTQSYQARIIIDNSLGTVKPGMFARASIVMDRAEDALTISRNDLIHEGGKYFVYTINNNKAEKKEVATGLDNNERVEITSGIDENDSVVSKGQEYLEEGTEVETVRSEAK